MTDTIHTIFFSGIEILSLTIELIAVLIIVGAVILGILSYLKNSISPHESASRRYSGFREGLGRSLLLGLEILVAADVIRTVALQQTLESIISLGLLVCIRTFLSWALIVEIEGRWPWQKPAE